MPLRFRLGRGVGACLLVLASQLPVSAQIYSWRAADGTLMLSTQKPAGEDAQLHSYAGYKAAEAAFEEGPLSPKAQQYNDLIVEHARRNDVRPSLVRAVIQVESAFNPIATSPKGAMGLMQLMPATAREFGVNNPYDPEQNVRGGVQYLKQLLDRYDSDERLALAAYNAGPGAVDKYGQEVPPYQETKNYVVKVNKIAGATKKADKPAGQTLYRTVEIVDGRPVVKYTDQKPTATPGN